VRGATPPEDQEGRLPTRIAETEIGIYGAPRRVHGASRTKALLVCDFGGGLRFQELNIHCMESSCCDSQIGGGVQPKSVNDDQKKGAIPTEGPQPVKRSGPKLVIS
jgi:hypothetical protein